MRTSFASILFLGGVAACGGSSLDPGAGNAAGTGTATLAVDGSARAQPRTANASDAADFDTEFEVRISLNNQTVTTGTVAVTSRTGKTALTYGVDGHWTGTLAGYDQVYVLDVVSGSDKIEGVRVDGPDVHVFSEPTQGATVDASVPLMLAWDRQDAADTARLRAEHIDSITIPDSGTYSLAPGSLQTDRSVARPNTLRLTRSNRVAPAGAVAGSTWTVSVENTLDVVAQPQALPL